jgi:hypothetical protein
MFIYVKIGNSKFIEMNGVASDTYPSALVFYTGQRVNIMIYRTVYYPLANEVVKGYSNATIRPSFRPSFRNILVIGQRSRSPGQIFTTNILVNTLESTSFNVF